MSCFLAPERKDRRERDYASSGPTLPSADRATPVERPSHSRQLLVPREWHALRIRIRIPYACTTIPLTDARRLPLWSYVHADAPRHPCRHTHTSMHSQSICFLTETLYTTRKVLLIRLTRQYFFTSSPQSHISMHFTFAAP